MPRLDFQKLAQEREDFEVVLVDGDVVTLPKVVPANEVLKVMAGRSPQQVAELPEKERNDVGHKMIEAIVGKENLEKILNGIGHENITDFTQEVYYYYGLSKRPVEGEEPAEEGEEGEDEEGKGAEVSQLTRSSSTSEPSTPTLNGSTLQAGEPSTEESSTGNTSSPESDTYQPRASS